MGGGVDGVWHDALVDDSAIAELRRLQARAYAPEADIHRDDDALQRLEELQALSRAPMVAPAQDVDASTPAVAEPHEEDDAPAPEPRSEIAEPAPPTRPRWRPSGKLVAFLWPVSLLLVASVAGAVSHATAPRAPLTADAHHVATLQQNPDFMMPEFFGLTEDDSVGFRDFFGLTAVASESAYWGANGDSCLLLIPSDRIEADAMSFQGPVFSGCGAGSFPTTIELVVTDDLPDALLDRFPEGSALQFVLEDSRIDVYSDAD